MPRVQGHRVLPITRFRFFQSVDRFWEICYNIYTRFKDCSSATLALDEFFVGFWPTILSHDG